MSRVMSGAYRSLLLPGNISEGEQQRMLTKHVKDIFTPYLQIESGDRLSESESFFELGLTSLAATEIQGLLERSLDVKLDSSTIFNNPSVQALVSYLRKSKLAVARLDPNQQALESGAGGHQGPNGRDDELKMDEAYIRRILNEKFGI